MEKFKKSFLIIGITLFVLIGIKQIIPVLKLDGYSGLLLSSLLSTDDSVYSEGYTGRKFLKIETGMTKDEVYKILGEPINIFVPIKHTISLQYSTSPKDTHYRIRQIYLRENKVAEVVSYFYVD